MEAEVDEELTGAVRVRAGSTSAAPRLVLPGSFGPVASTSLSDLAGPAGDAGPRWRSGAGPPDPADVDELVGRLVWCTFLAAGTPTLDPSPAAVTDRATWHGAMSLQALHAADQLVDAGHDDIEPTAAGLAAHAVDDVLVRAGSVRPPSRDEWLLIHRRLDPFDDRWVSVHELALEAERRGRHHGPTEDRASALVVTSPCEPSSVTGNGVVLLGSLDLSGGDRWALDPTPGAVRAVVDGSTCSVTAPFRAGLAGSDQPMGAVAVLLPEDDGPAVLLSLRPTAGDALVGQARSEPWMRPAACQLWVTDARPVARPPDDEASALCRAHWAEDLAAAADDLRSRGRVVDPNRAAGAAHWTAAAEAWDAAASAADARGADQRASHHRHRAARCRTGIERPPVDVRPRLAPEVLLPLLTASG